MLTLREAVLVAESMAPPLVEPHHGNMLLCINIAKTCGGIEAADAFCDGIERMSKMTSQDERHRELAAMLRNLQLARWCVGGADYDDIRCDA